MFKNFTKGVLKPEIVTYEYQKNLRPLLFVVAGVVLFISAISGGYYIYRQFKADKNLPKQSPDVENEDVSKLFSFKRLAKKLSQDDNNNTIVELSNRVEALGSNKNTKIVKIKPPQKFQKYKSIPTKIQLASAGEGVSEIDGSDSKSDTDFVIAESIQIDPDFLLQKGTYIPCSLTTRFVSEVAGRIQCMINQDVYSASGRVKLIERGTKAISMYQSGTLEHGKGRMHVIWTKLLTPDHKRVNLVDTQVVGRLGEAGIDGRVDSHFMQRFGGALMISFIQDVVSHATERHANHSKRNTININSYEKTRDGVTAVAEKMLESSVNIPPTMYKKQGDIVGIEVGKDIDFSKIYSLKVKHDC